MMPNGQLAERLDSLESYMKDLSFQALRTEREIARLSAEMREFKNEMREFKKGMLEFKNGMLEFKEQAEIDRRESNRKWGELANKMGTLVEDIVAPNLPTVARELFGCDEAGSFAVRVKRRLGSKTMELDALLVCKGVALINETKSSLNNRDVDGLAAKLETFDEFFPEYAGKRCVGIIASLYIDESVVRYATSQKILCMGMKDDTMRVLNPEAAQL